MAQRTVGAAMAVAHALCSRAVREFCNPLSMVPPIALFEVMRKMIALFSSQSTTVLLLRQTVLRNKSRRCMLAVGAPQSLVFGVQMRHSR